MKHAHAELERELASSEEICRADKAILIAETEAHTETKRQLAEARKAAECNPPAPEGSKA